MDLDLNRLRWQQDIRQLALKGLNHFPTLTTWLDGRSAEETNLYYTNQGEHDRYEQWCHYLKAAIFQGIALQDYEEWEETET